MKNQKQNQTETYNTKNTIATIIDRLQRNLKASAIAHLMASGLSSASARAIVDEIDANTDLHDRPWWISKMSLMIAAQIIYDEILSRVAK